jgi:transglutaminase-like putative cysteine protease
MPSRAKTLALGAAAAAPIAWNWMRFEDGASAGRATLLVLLALVPALGSRRWRFPLAVACLLVAAAVAFRLRPGPHYPGRLASHLWTGFLSFYDVQLPFAAVAHRNMDGTVLLAVFAFTAAAVLAISARRPGLAATVLLVGAGWPATLLAGHELLRGAVILAALLVLLSGLRERGATPGWAVAVGAAIVLAGVGASTSSALAKREFLRWQSWDLHVPGIKPVDVSYVWSSDYSGLTFPRKKTVVLRIKAPARPQYWRVTELADIVQGRWREETVLDQGPGLGEPGLVPPAAQDESNWIEQRIKVEGLRDTQLPAAEVPVQFDVSGLGGVDYDQAGVAYLTRQLHQGDSYTAWSYEPQPTPQELSRSKPIYPPVITEQKKYLEVEWGGVWAPPFGTPGREEAVRKLFASHYQLAPYRPLYDMARSVAGGARSPYAAAVALESWFRTGGGFTYNQHPPPTRGRPVLVDFVTRTRSGYCQHFAGAMALMLRYLGVPTRIAAGFASGTYQNGQWVVTDHDAHEWVEVWFRGWGWVPFDPTPGRGGVSGAYSASSHSFDPAVAAFVLAGKQGLRAFATRRSELGFPQPRTSPFAPDVRLSRAPGVPTAAAGHSRTAPGLLPLLLLLLVGVGAVVAAAKFALRRARYLTRDPRRVAAACRRELQDILIDQRVDVSPSATLIELTQLTQEELGVDTTRLGIHATVARFAPPRSARAAARELRRSLRKVRRNVRQELSGWERARGLLSLRSLGLS